MRCLDVLLLSACLAPAVVAQTGPSPAIHSSQRAIGRQTASQPPDAGTIYDGIYRNPYFHVEYRIPVSWVDRTTDLRQAAESGKGMVLLAVFERPPEAPGDTVNPAVVIAAEPLTSYPGLKTAADYLSPLTELTTGKGFKVVNEPYNFPIGHQTMVRGDFSKSLPQHAVQQASLVEVAKGYFVSFTFVGEDEQDIDDLIRGLSLVLPEKPAPKP